MGPLFRVRWSPDFRVCISFSQDCVKEVVSLRFVIFETNDSIRTAKFEIPSIRFYCYHLYAWNFEIGIVSSVVKAPSRYLSLRSHMSVISPSISTFTFVMSHVACVCVYVQTSHHTHISD
ncbi:hypothetical protein KP509_05G094700 [Ceratopteris richardii]|uniref:Uncharacterized protein n=1 Tax=Ceratopteris richardii TaxID=49495 RepID=A0A8T2UWS4_CERRI|nr:hypothetical protein KP509_05G094700 [Ceratopteris richardii]